MAEQGLEPACLLAKSRVYLGAKLPHSSHSSSPSPGGWVRAGSPCSDGHQLPATLSGGMGVPDWNERGPLGTAPGESSGQEDTAPCALDPEALLTGSLVGGQTWGWDELEFGVQLHALLALGLWIRALTSLGLSLPR